MDRISACFQECVIALDLTATAVAFSLGGLPYAWGQGAAIS